MSFKVYGCPYCGHTKRIEDDQTIPPLLTCYHDTHKGQKVFKMGQLMFLSGSHFLKGE